MKSVPKMARSVYVPAPPAPSATVPAGQPAQGEKHRSTYIPEGAGRCQARAELGFDVWRAVCRAW